MLFRIMKKLLKIILVILGAVLAALLLFVLVALIANPINRASMEEYIDGWERVEYENQLTPNIDERGNYYFTTDGEFRVMQITDVHLGGGFLFSEGDRKAIYAVAEMISTERPDLVVATGDISFAVPWSGTLNNAYAHGYFTRLMENLGVYYTVTFGNHDTEKYNYHDRAAVGKMYESEELRYCLFSTGPADVYGECNHVINVTNTAGLITSSMVVIDSNSYSEKDVFGIGWDYDNVHDDQIDWYRENIEYYTQRNIDLYTKLDISARPADFDPSRLQSFMYMHIPPAEMRGAYLDAAGEGSYDADKHGIVGEGEPYVFSSEYPDGLFEEIVALGSTRGVFFGHDHLNSLRFVKDGVLLAYGMSIDYSAYAGGTGYQRGCAVLTLDGGEWDFVQLNYYSGRYDNLPDDVDMQPPLGA